MRDWLGDEAFYRKDSSRFSPSGCRASLQRRYQLIAEISADDAFEHRTHEETYERTYARAQGGCAVSSAEQFPDECAQKRPYHDAPRHEEEAQQRARQTAPRTPSAATGVFAAPHRYEIVQYLNGNYNRQPHQQLSGREGGHPCEVGECQSRIGHGRAGQHREDTTHKSEAQAQDSNDDDDGFHERFLFCLVQSYDFSTFFYNIATYLGHFFCLKPNSFIKFASCSQTKRFSAFSYVSVYGTLGGHGRIR